MAGGSLTQIVFSGALVFELGEDAFVLFDVLPRPQVHRLIQGIALPEGVEVADLDHLTYCGHFGVGRNGNVATGNPPLTIEQTQFDAALVIQVGDHSRTGSVELVLELSAAAVGSSWRVRGIQSLEHHAFLSLSLQMTEQALFVGRVRGDLCKLNMRSEERRVGKEC